MKILVAYSILLAFTACNSNQNNTVENKDSLTINKKQSNTTRFKEKECFANYTPKDSVKLTLINNGYTVTGTLEIKLLGKDENKGNYTGMMKGDTLIADYSFFSEGVLSVRQIVFLKRNNTLIEGHGEVAEIDGKMSFKKLDQLKFDEKAALKIVACPE